MKKMEMTTTMTTNNTAVYNLSLSALCCLSDWNLEHTLIY